ncbi:uncharacterized protein [Lolium perenne]|uniref:uncharacterized protein n=1 Tax=Lolium perenne TaxID=4522 RepID=UPI003A999B38
MINTSFSRGDLKLTRLAVLFRLLRGALLMEMLSLMTGELLSEEKSEFSGHTFARWPSSFFRRLLGVSLPHVSFRRREPQHFKLEALAVAPRTGAEWLRHAYVASSAGAVGRHDVG